MRIGSKYLKGALGYGGPCFPRDNSALACLLEEMGVSSDLPRVVDRLNRRQPARIVSMVDQLGLSMPVRVAVLGLAYKPNTNIVEESQGIDIARRLAEKGFEVSVFDPFATESARKLLGNLVRYSAGIADCVRDAAVIVVATDWAEFRSVFHQTTNSRPRPLIIDGWRLLRSTHGLDACSYRAVGIGHPQHETRERLRRFVEQLARPKPVNKETEKDPKAEAAAT